MRVSSMTRAMLLAIAVFVSPAAYAEGPELQRPGYALQTKFSGQGPLDVVFESGFGQGADVWDAVVAELGASCHCLAYARAGLGKSGTDGQAKSLQNHLEDLGAVADALAPGRPIVLVGHSYGGLLATEFARRHPGRVAALVLVDPTTLGQRHAFMAADRGRVLADDKMLLDMLPPALGADYRLLVQQLDAPEATVAAAMPDIPVMLLTSTQVAQDPFVLEETAEGKAIWKRLHGALFATFSSGSHFYFATGHNIHRERPKDVADAIRAAAAAASASPSGP
jgi:pimeloyl-ACP methyl ester carboxylesterase